MEIAFRQAKRNARWEKPKSFLWLIKWFWKHWGDTGAKDYANYAFVNYFVLSRWKRKNKLAN